MKAKERKNEKERKKEKIILKEKGRKSTRSLPPETKVRRRRSS